MVHCVYACVCACQHRVDCECAIKDFACAVCLKVFGGTKIYHTMDTLKNTFYGSSCQCLLVLPVVNLPRMSLL